MIDLTKKSLPNTVTVGNREFSIYTDYRLWLRFSIEFEKWMKAGQRGSFDIRYLFKNELPVFRCLEDYGDILRFAFPQTVVPRSERTGGAQVLFYDTDGDYIYAAFLQQYGIDLVDVKELHWHKFKALLSGICEPTKLHEIMGYRSYTGEKVKDMDVQYRRLRDAWMPPYEETEEEKRATEEFDKFFE